MTPIHDTAQLAGQPPVPALWATTVFSGLVCVILMSQVVFNFTKLRMVCLVACITTLFLTITNTIDTYYPIQVDAIHTLMFALFTILYFDLIIAIFLDIGGAFYYLKDRKTALYWVVLALAVAFSLIAGIASFFLFLYPISDLLIFILAVVAVVACLAGMVGAVVYAFVPIISNRKIPSTQSDVYAVGIWYLTVVMTIMICYIVFYALAFVNVVKYNPFGPINQGVDFCFRSVLVLAYGLPPSPKIIGFISKNLVILTSRATSPASSNQNRWSSGVAPESKDLCEFPEIIVVAYPVERAKPSPLETADITD